MQEMRESYDRLLSVAAATANSAYGKKYIYNFLSSTLVNIFVLFVRVFWIIGGDGFMLGANLSS